MRFSQSDAASPFDWMWPEFVGAKLALFCDNQLLTCLRDPGRDVEFPGRWDLPGGARLAKESPVECAQRHLMAECGLTLAQHRLRGHVFPSILFPGMQGWLFTGTLDPAEISTIRKACRDCNWQMMPVDQYVTHPRAVPHYREWIRAAQDRLSQPFEPAAAAHRL